MLKCYRPTTAAAVSVPPVFLISPGRAGCTCMMNCVLTDVKGLFLKRGHVRLSDPAGDPEVSHSDYEFSPFAFLCVQLRGFKWHFKSAGTVESIFQALSSLKEKLTIFKSHLIWLLLAISISIFVFFLKVKERKKQHSLAKLIWSSRSSHHPTSETKNKRSLRKFVKV